MKNRISNVISSWRKRLYYLGLGLGGILFLQQVWQGIQTVRQQTLQLDQPVYLVLAISMSFIAFVPQMAAWTQIMRGLGSPIKLGAVYRGYMISFLPHHIPGAFWGYISRGEWLESNWRTPHAVSALGSALEVGLILFSASVAAVVCYAWFGISGPAGLVTMIGMLLLPPVIAWLGFTFLWTRYVIKWVKVPGLFRQVVIDFVPWLKAYTIYLAMWLCHGAALTLLLQAFNIDYNGSIFQSTYLFTLSWLIGFIILIVPSGLGIREFVLAELLTTYAQTSGEMASAIAISMRFSTYLGEIVWLILSVALTHTFLKVSWLK